jgi:UDP-glucose 4-epimerase
MALVWVIGKGGLLGSALYQELSQQSNHLFDPKIQICWHDKDLACEQLKDAVDAFALQAKDESWKIYWAAGIGTMHSTAEELKDETDILRSFIAVLANKQDLNLQSGNFVFASSAGAIYAGRYDDPINESTVPSPINAYGHAKLEQESIVKKLNQIGTTVISCRITTLYGFKQKNGKQQGLLAEMVRRALSNEVIHIYVPLETMRDYIGAKVAAQEMIHSVSHLEKTPGVYIKIIASGVSTSIAQIISILRRISKRNLRIVTQADVKSGQYQRVVQFQSEVGPISSSSCQTSLIEGIAELLLLIKRDKANAK